MITICSRLVAKDPSNSECLKQLLKSTILYYILYDVDVNVVSCDVVTSSTVGWHATWLELRLTFEVERSSGTVDYDVTFLVPPKNFVSKKFPSSSDSNNGNRNNCVVAATTTERMSRRKQYVAATSFTVLVHVAAAFKSNVRRLHSYQPNLRNKQSSSSLARRQSSFSAPSPSSEPETELWLDLRPTAIHPKAAMDHLESQLGSESFVDRIILSEHIFQNLVDYSDLYLSASRILYHDTTNNDIFSATGRGLSFPFGRFQSPTPDATIVVDDPIPAIEVIASGKWLFLGNCDGNVNDGGDLETLRMCSVGNFLEFATTASGCGLWTSSSDNTSGLLLPTSRTEGISSNDRTEADGAGRGGGVAVSCNTKSAVMKLASTLQLVRPGTMTVVTDSGIIVQSSNNSFSNLNTAAVLPFETDIWQVALLVFGTQGMKEIGP
jgi:hypothetical protein